MCVKSVKMFSMFEAACLVYINLPIHTQINLAHTALQVSVWSLKQTYAMYKYMKPNKTSVLIITVQPPNEDGFVEVDASI